MECRFPNRLKKYRRCACLSQKKVAKALGFADTSIISRWEHGASIPGLPYVFKLSKLYDADPKILFGQLWHQVDADERLLAILEHSKEAKLYH